MNSRTKTSPGRSAKRLRPTIRGIALALLCGLLLLCACGCGAGGGFGDNGNRPYEPDTPAPPPHEGKFVSAHGTMTFSGDGKTVSIDFDEDLAARLGLPAGEQEASYAFFTGYLPPHGHIETRYDAAMFLQLTVGEGDGAVRAMIEVGEFKDGSFYTGTNCTTADRITFFVEKTPGGGDREPVDFLRS